MGKKHDEKHSFTIGVLCFVFLLGLYATKRILFDYKSMTFVRNQEMIENNYDLPILDYEDDEGYIVFVYENKGTYEFVAKRIIGLLYQPLGTLELKPVEMFQYRADDLVKNLFEDTKYLRVLMIYDENIDGVTVDNKPVILFENDGVRYYFMISDGSEVIRFPLQVGDTTIIKEM